MWTRDSGPVTRPDPVHIGTRWSDQSQFLSLGPSVTPAEAGAQANPRWTPPQPTKAPTKTSAVVFAHAGVSPLLHKVQEDATISCFVLPGAARRRLVASN